MKKIIAILSLVVLLLFVAAGCAESSGGLQHGYYTAEAAEYDAYGWKEYVTIFVSDNRIITVEYNAKNASGFIKSWDMDYMRIMDATDGTYPNEYTRQYAEALVSRQNPDEVDAIAGATHSNQSFKLLAQAAMEQSRKASEDVAYVALPDNE